MSARSRVLGAITLRFIANIFTTVFPFLAKEEDTRFVFYKNPINVTAADVVIMRPGVRLVEVEIL